MPRPKLGHQQLTCHVPEQTRLDVMLYAEEHGLTHGEIFNAAWQIYQKAGDSVRYLAETNESQRIEIRGLKEALAMARETNRELEGKVSRAQRRMRVHTDVVA